MSPDLMRAVCDRIHHERLLSIEAATNPDFLEALKQDPQAAVESLLGAPLPTDVEVEVAEMRPDRIRVTLPPAAPENGELSLEDMESAAGGLGMLQGMLSTNGALATLQARSETQSSSFQTLSNAMKAAQDAEMNIVRNTKG